MQPVTRTKTSEQNTDIEGYWPSSEHNEVPRFLLQMFHCHWVMRTFRHKEQTMSGFAC